MSVNDTEAAARGRLGMWVSALVRSRKERLWRAMRVMARKMAGLEVVAV